MPSPYLRTRPATGILEIYRDAQRRITLTNPSENRDTDLMAAIKESTRVPSVPPGDEIFDVAKGPMPRFPPCPGYSTLASTRPSPLPDKRWSLALSVPRLVERDGAAREHVRPVLTINPLAAGPTSA
jgi:hypothetical protein